jgi:plasmid stabilization system protein ParE
MRSDLSLAELRELANWLHNQQNHDAATALSALLRGGAHDRYLKQAEACVRTIIKLLDPDGSENDLSRNS